MAPRDAAAKSTSGGEPPRAADVVPLHGPLDFSTVYRRHFRDVCRWLRAMAIPDGDREDVAQEVFVVVERKLATCDAPRLRAWLYSITERTASDHRRRAWWKNLFLRRKDVPVERAGGADPAESLDRKERRALLHRLLGRLSEKRRTTLALFEIEGYSCEEIARLQDIPEATVRTRLHHARRELYALVAALPPEPIGSPLPPKSPNSPDSADFGGTP